MAVLLSLHKSIFTLLARNRPVYCKVRYEQKRTLTSQLIPVGFEMRIRQPLSAPCSITCVATPQSSL